MNIKHVVNYQKSFVIMLIIFSIFISSCSNDGFITQSSDTRNLNKPSDTYTTGGPLGILTGLEFLSYFNPQAANDCFLLIELFAPYLFGEDSENSSSKYATTFKDRDLIIEKSYDFRDNYLNKVDKGKIYTYCYYKLSDYSIKNNILGKYYKEHMKITPICVDIAYELQHGPNQEMVIFNNTNIADLKKMIKIYRNTDNHNEIDPILDYLETDLETYYNKTKSEISADFRF